ncbi:MAG: MerR family DNA-binding transcriptional regulator [Elusimicrobia bacterium]|nr:MerR family DNA-binding transcriptional regulator [Elusimicrobiota bacterium]
MMPNQFIGVIAKQSGVPIKTIRYYEDVGLLPKATRAASGYRLYAADAVDRLQFIKKADRRSASYYTTDHPGQTTRLSASLQASRQGRLSHD